MVVMLLSTDRKQTAAPYQRERTDTPAAQICWDMRGRKTRRPALRNSRFRDSSHAYIAAHNRNQAYCASQHEQGASHSALNGVRVSSSPPPRAFGARQE